jgi:hypothetical protein
VQHFPEESWNIYLDLPLTESVVCFVEFFDGSFYRNFEKMLR